MATGSVGGIVCGMSVIAGHGMPERAKGGTDGVGHDGGSRGLRARSRGGKGWTRALCWGTVVAKGRIGEKVVMAAVAAVAITGRKGEEIGSATE